MVCGPRRGGNVHDLLTLAGLGAPEIGEVSRARALCEKLLAYASPLLLYAEEIDQHTGRHPGNFPQAFSRLAGGGHLPRDPACDA
jgi:GH15 family glucan-1,4-alpha-glucosidase